MEEENINKGNQATAQSPEMSEQEKDKAAAKANADLALKGAATYFGGPEAAKAVDTAKKIPVVGNKIDKLEDKAADQITKNKALNKVSRKLNDSGATELGNQALDAYNGSAGGGVPGGSPMPNVKGANALGGAGGATPASNINANGGKPVRGVVDNSAGINPSSDGISDNEDLMDDDGLPSDGLSNNEGVDSKGNNGSSESEGSALDSLMGNNDKKDDKGLDSLKNMILRGVMPILLAMLPYILAISGITIFYYYISFVLDSHVGVDLNVTHRNPYLKDDWCYNYDNTENGNCFRGDESTHYVDYSLSFPDELTNMFPEGAPQNPSDMAKYLTDIVVDIYDRNGNPSTLRLSVHKGLANNFQSIFEELYAMKYPIDVTGTYVYSWRNKTSGSGLSMHSYGIAIDINPTQNGGVHGNTDPNSNLYVNDDVVSVFKKYGFYWGGDWSDKYYDPMHFSYVNQ